MVFKEGRIRRVSVSADAQGFSVGNWKSEIGQVSCVQKLLVKYNNPYNNPVFCDRVSVEKSKIYIPNYSFSNLRLKEKKKNKTKKRSVTLQQMACPQPSPDLTIINLLCDCTFRNRNESEPGCADEPKIRKMKMSAVVFPDVSECHKYLIHFTLSFLELTSSLNIWTNQKFQHPYWLYWRISIHNICLSFQVHLTLWNIVWN